MRSLGCLVFILCLLPLAALAEQAPSPTPLQCAKLDPLFGERLSLTPPEARLFAEPQRDQTAKAAGEKEMLLIENDPELVIFLFRTPGAALSPWLGAGLETGNETEEPTGYRFGAGFGCELGPMTRLNLGYRFSSDLGLESSGPPKATDTERGQFRLGLQTSF